MQLPTFEESEVSVNAGLATPIETFIENNEPVQNDRLWRRQLLDALNFAAREGTIYTEI
jgi:hypothetical protein